MHHCRIQCEEWGLLASLCSLRRLALHRILGYNITSIRGADIADNAAYSQCLSLCKTALRGRARKRNETREIVPLIKSRHLMQVSSPNCSYPFLHQFYAHSVRTIIRLCQIPLHFHEREPREKNTSLPAQATFGVASSGLGPIEGSEFMSPVNRGGVLCSRLAGRSARYTASQASRGPSQFERQDWASRAATSGDGEPRRRQGSRASGRESVQQPNKNHDVTS